MSRGDYVGNYIYAPFLNGGNFKDNAADGRLAMLERMHVRRLTEKCANRFDWKGFPDSVNVRYLELTLFYRGLVVAYDDPDFGFLALEGTPSAGIDMYRDPLGFTVSAPGIVFRGMSAKPGLDSAGKPRLVGVPIWANYLRQPDLDIVYLYATRLAEIDLTREINSKSARQTKILRSNRNTRLSMRNINDEMSRGAAVVEVDESLNLEDQLSAFDLGINPDIIEAMDVHREKVYNECMAELGINGANQNKKERMVVDEVNANDEQIDVTKAVALNERRVAADKINALFGLNVTVDYHVENPPELESSGDDGSDTDPGEDEDDE